MDNSSLYRISVVVRCSNCLERHGAGTSLGEVIMRHTGQWEWVPHARLHRPAIGKSPARRVKLRHFAAVATTGGIEITCRRCRRETRTTVAKLARRAGSVAAETDTRPALYFVSN